MRKMFPLHVSQRMSWVSQQPVVAVAFSYDCGMHGTHCKPLTQPHTQALTILSGFIVSGLICGGTKVSSSTKRLLSSTFQSISPQKWKNKHKPGLHEWWFPPIERGFNKSNTPKTHMFSPSFPLIRGQIYMLTSFGRRINAKSVIKSSRKPGHLAIKI